VEDGARPRIEVQATCYGPFLDDASERNFIKERNAEAPCLHPLSVSCRSRFISKS